MCPVLLRLASFFDEKIFLVDEPEVGIWTALLPWDFGLCGCFPSLALDIYKQLQRAPPQAFGL